MAVVISAIVFLLVGASAQQATHQQHLTKQAPEAGTCGVMKDAYKRLECCGQPSKTINVELVPMNAHMVKQTNPCAGVKSKTQPALDNRACFIDDVINVSEQSGTNVTKGYVGDLTTDAEPIMTPYFQQKLCPVNVHWHLGTEHYSMGQYDEIGTGPDGHIADADSYNDRRLADKARLGFRCRHYNADNEIFTKPYVWQHCVDMVVGETYEVHWPHSTMGACQTPFQFQTPFYDGVFCNMPDNLLELVGEGKVNVSQNIGVQAQIFTIVNDEQYYHPDLMRHAIVDNKHWVDVAYYTGSTTGTSRNNVECSGYAPITWQVDRTCHLISASSFDKMCFDMKSQHDDMSGDIHPHGSRELVADNLAADNHVRRM